VTGLELIKLEVSDGIIFDFHDNMIDTWVILQTICLSFFNTLHIFYNHPLHTQELKRKNANSKCLVNLLKKKLNRDFEIRLHD